jgi:hypothetical protein
MILNIRIEEQDYPVEVPDGIINGAQDFYDSLDRDMDQGWQMSRSWVDIPDKEQRCQIVADKILSAFEHENRKLLLLLCAYILSKMPGIKVLDISTNGEMQETLFEF